MKSKLSPTVNLKVLVIDDIKSNLKYMAHLMKSVGYDVFLEHRSLEALNAARTYNPDIIFLDIMMPDLDGFEVCRQLKSGDTT